MSFDERDEFLYEIIELRDGEIALARADGDGEPLVTIRFSTEALFHMEDKKEAVVKAMIEAGLDVVSQYQESFEEPEALKEDPVLH